MKIAVLKEEAGETRCAAIPETVKKFVALGAEVAVENGAGKGASIADSDLGAAGASVGARKDVLSGAGIILCINGPDPASLDGARSGALLVGALDPARQRELVDAYAKAGLEALAMEWMPRITRAQSMDILSSQSNLAGYKAVVDAAAAYGRAFPMMMTAAGTVSPAKVFVMGVGVAGLQAIATAKRLGAVIEASDVRPAVKEQIESLGAKFLDVPYLTDEEKQIAQGAGGYARPMPADWMRRQAELVHERAKAADIVITTALIPGRPAPVLIKEETVRAMKPGAVLLDMAIEQGGNCPLTERDKVVVKHGVKIIGWSNLPAMVGADASALYARNLINFLALLVDPKTGESKLDRADEIIAGSLVCTGGEVVKKS